MPDEFRDITIRLTKQLTLKTKKENGIYCTPKKIRDKIFQYLSNFQPSTILEPSFGSGEFIYDCLEKYPDAHITGIELNPTLYSSVQEQDRLTLINDDFRCVETPKVDLIIGNPPYLVIKDKKPECMSGRGNLFVYFLYKCLTSHLIPGGYLAFVLPTSFLNCSYYEACRDYIYKNHRVCHIEICENVKYLDTTQQTMVIIIKNEESQEKPYFFRKILSPFANQLEDLVRNSLNLVQLGFKVRTGTIIWNEHKNELSNDENNGVLLIYDTNIVSNTLVLNNMKNLEKKQYIRETKKTDIGPAILITRGFGNNYRFQYVFVPEGVKFYAENHLNVITPTNAESLSKIQLVLSSLGDDRTKKFLNYYIGNGALSKSEIEKVIPIYEN